jgi:hypothetical protein
VVRERHIWIVHRQPFMAHMLLERIGFLDETWLKTNTTKTTGWAPRGQRFVDHAPFGHWRTQTFVAALRHDRLDAPWVIDGTMTRATFDTYVETMSKPNSRRRCAKGMSSSWTTSLATKANTPQS